MRGRGQGGGGGVEKDNMTTHHLLAYPLQFLYLQSKMDFQFPGTEGQSAYRAAWCVTVHSVSLTLF